MIIMSVDVGKARTGVAVSDSAESFAFPKKVIAEYNREKLIQKLACTATELGAQMIVVGNPVNMNGTAGEKSAECQEVAKMLESATGLPVKMFDERCTTVIAHSQLIAGGKKTKDHKKNVDAVAATVILEDFLKYRKAHPED